MRREPRPGGSGQRSRGEHGWHSRLGERETPGGGEGKSSSLSTDPTPTLTKCTSPGALAWDRSSCNGAAIKDATVTIR